MKRQQNNAQHKKSEKACNIKYAKAIVKKSLQNSQMQDGSDMFSSNQDRSNDENIESTKIPLANGYQRGHLKDKQYVTEASKIKLVSNLAVSSKMKSPQEQVQDNIRELRSMFENEELNEENAVEPAHLARDINQIKRKISDL